MIWQETLEAAGPSGNFATQHDLARTMATNVANTVAASVKAQGGFEALEKDATRRQFCNTMEARNVEKGLRTG